MKPVRFACLILVFLIAGCQDEVNLSKETPACILERIEAIKADGVWNPPAKIYQYAYQGKAVYYVPSRCCDIPSILYDEDCNVICNPDGGFSGQGSGTCSDFFKERTHEKLIWQDDRK